MKAKREHREPHYHTVAEAYVYRATPKCDLWTVAMTLAAAANGGEDALDDGRALGYLTEMLNHRGVREERGR